jgi:hypothetical protein
VKAFFENVSELFCICNTHTMSERAGHLFMLLSAYALFFFVHLIWHVLIEFSFWL